MSSSYVNWSIVSNACACNANNTALPRSAGRWACLTAPCADGVSDVADHAPSSVNPGLQKSPHCLWPTSGHRSCALITDQIELAARAQSFATSVTGSRVVEFNPSSHACASVKCGANAKPNTTSLGIYPILLGPSTHFTFALLQPIQAWLSSLLATLPHTSTLNPWFSKPNPQSKISSGSDDSSHVMALLLSSSEIMAHLSTPRSLTTSSPKMASSRSTAPSAVHPTTGPLNMGSAHSNAPYTRPSTPINPSRKSANFCRSSNRSSIFTTRDRAAASLDSLPLRPTSITAQNGGLARGDLKFSTGPALTRRIMLKLTGKCPIITSAPSHGAAPWSPGSAAST